MQLEERLKKYTRRKRRQTIVGLITTLFMLAVAGVAVWFFFIR